MRMMKIVLLSIVLLSGCGAPMQGSAPTSTQGILSASPVIPPTAAATQAIPASPLPTPVPRLMLAPTRTIPATALPTALPSATIPPTAVIAAESLPPARLIIGTIKLDQPIVSVGLDHNRMPVVPDHEVGWYNLSAKPGEGENIVLWGHVLPFRKAPRQVPPFRRLKELQPGEQVLLYDAEGRQHTYTVTRQVQVTPDAVEYILPRGRELLTMVSCIGDKVVTDGEVVDMTHRLITIAEPVDH